MLFFLFVVFSSYLHAATATVSCYDCPFEVNRFDYLVTKDKLPNALNNCTTKSLGDSCIIDVKWSRNPGDQTEIGLEARGEPRTAFIEHTLSGDVNLENKENQLLWTRSISYICSTDQCNSLSTLQRLLASLTMRDDFVDLGYLLTREIPFDDPSCLLWGNSTTLECATEMPPANCTQCSSQGMSQNGVLDICANCLLDDIAETFLVREVNYELINRTRADHWILECQSKNCNTIENGIRIFQKSNFDFDFVHFLNHANRMTINSIALLLCTILRFFYSN
jgi:hypothetical protein